MPEDLRDEARRPKRRPREALRVGDLSEADLQAIARAEVADRYHDLERELVGDPRPPGQGSPVGWASPTLCAEQGKKRRAVPAVPDCTNDRI